jgi:hypothetical protein
MNLTLSVPMQLILTAAIVASAVALLRPDPAELPSTDLAHDKPDAGRQAAARSPVQQGERPWKRATVAQATVVKRSPPSDSEVPPLPSGAASTADTAGMPPLPPPPEEPSHPDVVYLGRMIKDGKTQIFLASRGQPFVLRQGDMLDGTWVVQSISDHDVTLRHVGNGEIRLIATGDATAPHHAGAMPAQIGPRFLATNAPQHQVAN